MQESKVRSTGEAAESCNCSASYFKMLAQELGLKPVRLGSGDLVWNNEEVEAVRRLRARRRRNTEGVRP